MIELGESLRDRCRCLLVLNLFFRCWRFIFCLSLRRTRPWYLGDRGRFGGGCIMLKASINLTALSFHRSATFWLCLYFLAQCKSVTCDRRRRMSRPRRPSPARSTQGRPCHSWGRQTRPPRPRRCRNHRRHPGGRFNRHYKLWA